jgi:hypothetical protein
VVRHFEPSGSGGEVNRLIDGLCGERLPTIDLAQVDLAGGEQRLEQHGGGVCRRQQNLRLILRLKASNAAPPISTLIGSTSCKADDCMWV